jgi:hypothetical protein
MPNQKKHSYYKKKKQEKKDGGFGWCESCQKWFPMKEMYYGPCPFASEIYGNNTPTAMCKSCEHEAMMDI